jgi:nicotinamidase-related amidase
MRNEAENKHHAALLIMDVQSGIVGMIKEHMELIGQIKKAIQDARANNIPVIYVIVAFRKGFPEISPNNKSFSMIKHKKAAFSDPVATKIYSEITPQQNDILVIKRRVSAFAGSDLEVVLRSLGITHLVLSGIATSGVVLSTVREAADKDYKLTVLSDCCADNDPQVHNVLLTKVLPRQAEVMNVDTWSEKLRK